MRSGSRSAARASSTSPTTWSRWSGSRPRWRPPVIRPSRASTRSALTATAPRPTSTPWLRSASWSRPSSHRPGCRRPTSRSSAARGAREQRAPDGGERDGDQEPDDPAGIEDVAEDAAEQARGDADEGGREQPDLLTARENQPAEGAHNETGEGEPQQLE